MKFELVEPPGSEEPSQIAHDEQEPSPGGLRRQPRPLWKGFR